MDSHSAHHLSKNSQSLYWEINWTSRALHYLWRIRKFYKASFRQHSNAALHPERTRARNRGWRYSSPVRNRSQITRASVARMEDASQALDQAIRHWKTMLKHKLVAVVALLLRRSAYPGHTLLMDGLVEFSNEERQELKNIVCLLDVRGAAIEEAKMFLLNQSRLRWEGGELDGVKQLLRDRPVRRVRFN